MVCKLKNELQNRRLLWAIIWKNEDLDISININCEFHRYNCQNYQTNYGLNKCHFNDLFIPKTVKLLNLVKSGKFNKNAKNSSQNTELTFFSFFFTQIVYNLQCRISESLLIAN